MSHLNLEPRDFLRESARSHGAVANSAARQQPLSRTRILLLLFYSVCWTFAIFVSGCSSTQEPRPQIPITHPSRLCYEPLDAPCRSSQEAEALLRSTNLEIIDARDTPAGVQGAWQLTLRTSEGIKFRAKWRDTKTKNIAALPSDPRREVVAYHVQKLLLDPQEYVVPPSAAHCFPLKEYKLRVEPAKPTWSEINCVFGFLSYWLTDTSSIEEVPLDSDSPTTSSRNGNRLFFLDRFNIDKLYARKVARLNLITYIIEHGDPSPSQFLVSTEPFHAWSVDHSVSLTSMKNPLALFKEDWSFLLVPRITEKLARRILDLTRRDINQLALLESYRITRHGQIVSQPLSDASRTLAHYESLPGVRFRNGRLEIGATQKERRLIWLKIQNLQRQLTSRKLGAHL